MKTTTFIHQLDDAAILTAIGEAEQKSSGEIRLYVSSRREEDMMTAAQRRFAQLGMAKTRQRNGVLLYFAPQSQQFAIWGDIGVHEKCGDQFWHHIVVEMTPLLKQERFTEAIVLAIKRVGEVLTRHFPIQPGDINELPDRIERD